MAASTKETLAQADIILNRTNVALARSQRLIASWLPPKETTQNASVSQQPEQVSDDEDLQGDSELGGIGSKLQKDDPGLPDGAFRRRKLGSNDKLLEQLLGKKAAGQHRKAQAQRGGGGLDQSAPKPKPEGEERGKRKVREEESDEEDGRAAAFKTKKVQRAKKAADVKQQEGEPADAPETEQQEQQSEEVKAPQPPKPAAKPGKTRPPSYLDELLAKKANKKSKKKQPT